MREDIFFCVVGLGESGYAAARLLAKKKISVRATDSSDNVELRRKRSKLNRAGIKTELGSHSKKFYRGASLFVISPSVDKDNPVLRYALNNNIPVISEIELAWMYSPAKVIAITGTNGKTSVATYTYKVLKNMGLSVYLAGNIGIPFASIVENLCSNDIVVLELSSFQLEYTVNFHPYIAVLLNISEDHLDRHNSLQAYLDAKLKIFANQERGDFAILDLTERIIKEKSRSISSKMLNISSCTVQGLDFNKKAVCLICDCLGFNRNKFLPVIRRLNGLKHRTEPIGSVGGVWFINDSKATNPHSTKWALKNIDSEVILIAGGRDKNTDFNIVKDEISEKVKALVLIGEASQKILNSLGGFVEVIKLAPDLKSAVNIAFKEASRGDTVLLSPMCASFDMFKNYEHRGNMFKKIVGDFKKCGS
ncbi:MAG TPA: UDP-N-acetylmuramoyl-L-alanine--D-glutamate ligase [Candidatus Omnitrophica bacterium]|nr:UDP-N-acetylmuramoyl-L-alanine--D-glutamate ligase [Candidatus Omnitrophota bacterium]